MEEPERRGTNEDAEGRPEGQDERERTDGSPDDAPAVDEEPTEEAAPGRTSRRMARGPVWRLRSATISGGGWGRRIGT